MQIRFEEKRKKKKLESVSVEYVCLKIVMLKFLG